MEEPRDPHAPPTVKEELERKATDILIELAHASEQDLLEPRDLQVQAHLIWKLTAGLVDNEVSDLAERLATQAQEQLRRVSLATAEAVEVAEPKPVESKSVVIRFNHLTDPTREVSIRYDTAKPGITVITPSASAPWETVEKTVPSEVGQGRNRVLGVIVSKLKEQGYALMKP